METPWRAMSCAAAPAGWRNSWWCCARLAVPAQAPTARWCGW